MSAMKGTCNYQIELEFPVGYLVNREVNVQEKRQICVQIQH